MPETVPPESTHTSAPTPVPERVLGREPLPVRKRFYKLVSIAAVAEGYTVHLDGRPLRTPRKSPLSVTARPLAEALAAEWDAQQIVISPALMPVTRLVFTAIDAVANQRNAVAAEIGRYAASDLLCYRASDPAALAEQQAAAWDPILAWAATELGVAFKCTSGLMPTEQAAGVSIAIETALAPLDPFTLSGMHVLTTLTGSAVLALAVLRRHLEIDAAWRLAHLDEDWQIARWGADAEAEARRVGRLSEARSAAAVIAMQRA